MPPKRHGTQTVGNEKAGTMFIVPVAAIPKEGTQGWRRGVTRGCCIAVGLDPHRSRPRVESAIRWTLYSSPADAVANRATVGAERRLGPHAQGLYGSTILLRIA